MTTKRAYYTCPIMAMLAFRYHGIELELPNDHPEFGQVVDMVYLVNDVSLASLLDKTSKYYIKQKSMHMLEPIDSDQGYDAIDDHCYFEEGVWIKSRGKYADHPVEISRRQYAHFPWPEFEGVE